MRRSPAWALLAFVMVFPANTWAGTNAASATPVLPAALAQCEGGSGISRDTQIAGCTAFIQSAPSSRDNLAEALRIRCHLLEVRNRYDDAISDCNSAIKLRPGAFVFLLRGIAYTEKGDYGHAIADYSRALKLRPDLAIAQSLLAEAEKAKAALAHGQKPGDKRAWCDGKALPHEGFAQDLQISGCTALIRSGKEKPDDLARDYFNRAQAYDFEGKPDLAIPDYNEAVKRDPKNAETFFRLGSIYWLKHDDNRAIANLDRAVAIGRPRPVLYLTYRGYAHYDRHEFDLAVADYGRAIALEKDDADAFLHRSIAYTGKGDYGRALEDCHRAIELSHESEATEGYNSCGDAHFLAGAFKAAIGDYDHALKRWSEYPEALYGRGAAKMRMGDKAGGSADMVAAKKLQSNVEMTEKKIGIEP